MFELAITTFAHIAMIGFTLYFIKEIFDKWLGQFTTDISIQTIR